MKDGSVLASSYFVVESREKGCSDGSQADEIGSYNTSITTHIAQAAKHFRRTVLKRDGELHRLRCCSSWWMILVTENLSDVESVDPFNVILRHPPLSLPSRCFEAVSGVKDCRRDPEWS